MMAGGEEMAEDLGAPDRLTDGEIIDFFQSGEKKQLYLTRNITVLCKLIKSNRDIILSNTLTRLETGYGSET